MSDTLQDRLPITPEDYSEYNPDPKIIAEGIVSPDQLSRSIDFKPEYLRGLVQDATTGIALSDQSRGQDSLGLPHVSEAAITPRSVAALAAQVGSETVNLRHSEINDEMRRLN